MVFSILLDLCFKVFRFIIFFFFFVTLLPRLGFPNLKCGKRRNMGKKIWENEEEEE